MKTQQKPVRLGLPPINARAQLKIGEGHFGTVVDHITGWAPKFVIQYDGTRDDKGRRVRGMRVAYLASQMESFNWL